MLKVDFYSKLPLNVKLAYVVIVAKYNNQWVLVRHNERTTYEVPGGHIESGEDVFTAAKRELYEETGAKDFSLDLVSFYAVNREDQSSGGGLFFSVIKELSELPNYEIVEVTLFDFLPDNLTYQQIQPHLFKYVQDWLESKD